MEEGMRRLQDLIPSNAALQYLPEFLLEFGSAPRMHPEDRRAIGEADMIVLGARPPQRLARTHLPWSYRAPRDRTGALPGVDDSGDEVRGTV